MKKVLLVANTDWYLFRFRLPLAQYLRERGIEVVLVSPPGPYVSSMQAASFRWWEWKVERRGLNPWSETKAIWKLRQIIWAEQPNLIHLHTIKPVIYGSLAVWPSHQIALVRSITGRGYALLAGELRARLLGWFVRSIYRIALNIGNGITVFENETDRQFFIAEGLVDPNVTTVIEGVGVDTSKYIPLAEPDGEPVVVLAGRLLRDKGVDVFVDAARLLRQRIVARFVLVGHPDAGNPSSISVQTLERWIKEGVIEWWGWQSDMQKVFARCHIVCLPSLGEGIPTVLLEAAASERPIVTTDVPGCRDVIIPGVTGLLVPPRDPVALAHALERLICDQYSRQTMGKAGRELIMQRFSVDIVNAANYRMYKQLLGEESVA